MPTDRETATQPRDATDKVKLYGQPNSPEAYAIRDFLSRSLMEYDWVEIDCDATCRRELGLAKLGDARLPVVEFPDGERLLCPTVEDVAQRLGWVSEPSLREYDLSIFGAGPAGLSAAVYAASEGLKTVLVERDAVGGQAGSSSLIENYMGYPEGISGADLAERGRLQAEKFGVEILMLREGVKAEFRDNKTYTQMADGTRIVARANICATGVEWRRLNLPNEDRFLGAGLFYGAGVSEAPMCSKQQIFVIGGGNSAGQAVMHFSRYADNVTMLVRGPDLSASMSEYLVERIEKAPNVEVLFESEVTAIEGDDALSEIEITNRGDGSKTRHETCRLFVCIGGAPNTEWAKETAIVRSKAGYIITGPDLLERNALPECWPLERAPFYLETSVPGCFAAGDVRHNSIKRVASAVGEGAMAVTFAHRYLEETT